MARKNDRAPMRKREILEHFQQVLVEEGLEGASMAKIASHMGVNPALLVHYFKTKDDMIVELVDYILEKYETTFSKRIEKISNPSRRLKKNLDTMFSIDWISVVDTRVFYACYYLALRNPRVMERMQKMYSHFREYIAREIEFNMKSGVIPEADPEKDAELVIAVVEGLAFYRNVSGGNRTYKELGSYLKQRVVDMLQYRQGSQSK